MRKVYPPPELPPDFDPHRRLKLQFERLRLQSLPADHKVEKLCKIPQLNVTWIDLYGKFTF